MSDQPGGSPNNGDPSRQRGDQQPGPGGPGGPGAGTRQQSKGPMGWLALTMLVLLMLIVFQALQRTPDTITWQQFESFYEEGSIKDIQLKSGAIVAKREATTTDGPEQLVQVKINPGTGEFWAARVDGLTGGDFKSEGGPSLWVQILFSPFLFVLIFFLFIWFFLLRGLRSGGGPGGMLGSFGKSRHRVLAKESTGVTFTDVAGVEEAKEELVGRSSSSSRSRKKFHEARRGKIPQGVLLLMASRRLNR